MKLTPLMPLVLLAICAWHSSFGFAQRFSVTIEVPEVVLLGCEFSEDGSLFATGGDCIRVFHTDSGTPVQHFRPSIRPRKTDPIEFSFDDHSDVGNFLVRLGRWIRHSRTGSASENRSNFDVPRRID